MRKTGKALALAASVVLVTGCASNGGSFQKNVADSLNGAAAGIGNVASGMFAPYKNGVQIEQAQLDQLETGMNQSEVEAILGLPPEISEIGGKEIWSYPYTQINHFSANTNETTVVKFDASRLLERAYKTGTRTSSTGNPLVDAANGTQ